MFEWITHPVPAVIILLGLLVLVHEAGHYFAGKLAGVAVEIFSIGFGPVILNWKRKETDYRISIVPLGGFVKFYGSVPSEPVPDEVKGRELYKASIPWRAFITAAGPLANFLLAIVSFAVLGYVGILQPAAIVGDVMKGSPAEKAGLDFGDEIVAIDNKKIKNWRDFERKISSSADKELSLKVKRGQEEITLKMVPSVIETTDMTDRKVKIGRIGISRGIIPNYVAVSPLASIAERSGLKTGDRIIAASIASDKQNLKSTPTWHDVSSALYRFRLSEGKDWSIEVVGTDDVRRNLKIDISILPAVDPNLDVSPPKRSEALNQLGIQSSQLLIKKNSGVSTESSLMDKDFVVEVGGKTVLDLYSLRDVLSENKLGTLNFKINRQGKLLELPVALKSVSVQKVSGKQEVFVLEEEFYGQPQDPQPVLEQYSNIFSAIGFGISETWRYSTDIFFTLVALLSGEISTKALGGPMLIAKIAGDSAKLGWQAFLTSLAIISVNLGLLNLFPIPVLDGGQLVLLGIEAVRRKTITESFIENYQKIGFVLVMCLVVLATYNDLSRFWTSMLESVRGLF